MFDQLYDIPKERKTGEYRKYLTCLIEYLSWFIQRIKPLMDLDSVLEEEGQKAFIEWESGNCPGWPVSNSSDVFILYLFYNCAVLCLLYTYIFKFAERNWFSFSQCRCPSGFISIFKLGGISVSWLG